MARRSEAKNNRKNSGKNSDQNSDKKNGKSLGRKNGSREGAKRSPAGQPPRPRGPALQAEPAGGDISKSPRKRAGTSVRPIDLYFWPTPNGWKVSIMLEECGLPYRMIPLDISKGEQFKPAFLKISPNNRMPAIVDPDGPGGAPISVFESGAILQYLGRKTGRFYPRSERTRVEVDQWLFWQMANLGPKAGEASHFRLYAAEKLPYAIERFDNELNRLFGIMNTRLADRRFLAGWYSIADMACVGWARHAERCGLDVVQFPNVKRWLDNVRARPAVRRGMSIRVPEASRVDMTDNRVRAVPFGRR